jgi:hypothetical protein
MRLIKILLLSVILISSCVAQRQQPHRQRKLVFQGNSLFDTNVNHTINGLKYVTLKIYDNIRAVKTFAFFDFSVSGQDQTTINTLISTQISTFVKSGDIVVIWEGTNDLAHDNALTGAAAYAKLVTFIQACQAVGAKVIVCTAIARDLSGDAADLMTRIGDYNTLIRNNYVSLGVTLCDLGVDTHFDARGDCANATYYDTDKLHLVQTGQDLVASTITTSIQSIY